MSAIWGDLDRSNGSYRLAHVFQGFPLPVEPSKLRRILGAGQIYEVTIPRGGKSIRIQQVFSHGNGIADQFQFCGVKGLRQERALTNEQQLSRAALRIRDVDWSR